MVVNFGERVLVETRHGILLPVHVVPASRQFAIAGADEWKGSLKVRLQSKAERGKANKELSEKLGRFFGASVEIVKGKKQREKTLLLHAGKKRVIECLSSL